MGTYFVSISAAVEKMDHAVEQADQTSQKDDADDPQADGGCSVGGGNGEEDNARQKSANKAADVRKLEKDRSAMGRAFKSFSYLHYPDQAKGPTQRRRL